MKTSHAIQKGIDATTLMGSCPARIISNENWFPSHAELGNLVAAISLVSRCVSRKYSAGRPSR
jgi:hypothetical protein